MSTVIDAADYLQARDLSTVDVRSPGEFAAGHIPNAINMPLFNDEERAEVGTLYKQVGRPAAVTRGLEIVGSNARRFIDSIEAANIGLDFYVHCWRGGMRSEALTWFFDQCGMQPRRITGGYKAFRQAAHRGLAEPQRIVILSGATGVGKTKLLGALRNAGEQIIDLEGLAGHRGSAFGGIGRPPQPKVEQFENNLYYEWRDLDPTRPVWVECESQAIGKVFIPQVVWDQMKQAPAIHVDADRQQRVEFLLEEYGSLPVEELASAMGRIKKRLGGANLQAALDALECNDLVTFTEIALDYYDKAYSMSLKKRSRPRTLEFQLTDSGQTDAIGTLIEMGVEITNQSPRSSDELV
jgi:tRNA 2-selenouridine synthase